MGHCALKEESIKYRPVWIKNFPGLRSRSGSNLVHVVNKPCAVSLLHLEGGWMSFSCWSRRHLKPIQFPWRCRQYIHSKRQSKFISRNLITQQTTLISEVGYTGDRKYKNMLKNKTFSPFVYIPHTPKNRPYMVFTHVLFYWLFFYNSTLNWPPLVEVTLESVLFCQYGDHITEIGSLKERTLPRSQRLETNSGTHSLKVIWLDVKLTPHPM